MSGATKAEAEREMLHAWESLASAVDSFSEQEMGHPGVVDSWSIKDLLGHIAFWAQRSAENLQLIAAGRAAEIELPEGEKVIDEWNERERRSRAKLSLADVREEWLESQEKAMHALAEFPDDKLQAKVGSFTALQLFAVDTYLHYREHLAHLVAWRRQLETTEA